jgi:hypothetical protein
MKSLISKYSVSTVIFIALVAILFSVINYVENEGFSPTDEGVVLAQSWRIINGEQAHSDFISIRPAASGYLHSVNFAIPGALVTNARWFVLFQYMMICLVMIFLLRKNLFQSSGENIALIYFIAVLFVGLSITILNYNLYSWTTIDAVFWSVLSLPFILSNQRWKIVIGLIFLSFAALSRQTFVLIAFAAYLYIFIKNRKSFLKFLPVFFVGASVFILYLVMLLINNSFSDFISQMTGRTEFAQTAIIQFVKRFVWAYSTPFNAIVFVVFVYMYLKRKTGVLDKFKQRNLQVYMALAYAVFAILSVFRHFLLSRIDIYTMPFDLFFMNLFFVLFHFVLLPKKSRIRLITISVLLISWVSAISLGDNAPVFGAGPMFLVLIFLCADVISMPELKSVRVLTNKYFLLSISIVIFSLGIISQRNLNYRDLGQTLLVSGLSNSSEEFGNIKTNANLLGYYTNLNQVYDELSDAKDNTVVFPHNAMFYPVMQTQNPMSLDWLIANEYIGQEDRIEKDFFTMITEKQIYFIVDKVDTRIICDSIVIRNYENDLIYDLIIDNCQNLDVNSDFVEVYRSWQ